MRILIVTNFYPPTIFGGYELRCADMTRHLENSGHSCRIITSRHGSSHPQQSGNIYRQLHSFWDIPNKPKTLSGYLDALQEDSEALEHHIAEFRPDVISCWNFMGIGYSLAHTIARSGIPALWHMDDDWMLREEPYWKLYGDPDRTKAKAILNRGAHQRLDIRPVRQMHPRCVFISDYRRQRHVDAGMDVQEHPVIHGGVDLEMFHGTARPFPEEGPVKLLFCGALTRIKGIHTLIKAMEHLPPPLASRCVLDIVGSADQTDMNTLQNSIGTLNTPASINILGPFDREAMPDIYRQHDALVFPSEALEGFPLTILEAMACGLPVIATANGGQREYLRHDENALVIQQGDAEDIARAIAKLMGNPEKTRHMAEAGNSLVAREFGVRIMADKTEALLNSMVASVSSNENDLKQRETK